MTTQTSTRASSMVTRGPPPSLFFLRDSLHPFFFGTPTHPLNTGMITFLTFCESLDTPFPFHWTRRDDDYWQATFSLPTGEQYVLDIVENDGEWETAFLHKGKRDTFGIVGDTKQEFRIFATVVAGIKDFLKTMRVSELHFTAKEPSRVRLYRRLMSGVAAKIPGYRGSEAPKYGSETSFVITKT